MADILSNFFGFRAINVIQRQHHIAIQQKVANKSHHAISQLRMGDFLITVITVFFILLQIHVIDTGAAVKHGIIKNKAFNMQHTEHFARIDRHTEK